MRVKIKKQDSIPFDEQEKILISKRSLDRLLLDVLNEVLEEFLDEQVMEENTEQVCRSKGYLSLIRWLKITNAFQAATKAKLFKTAQH